MKPQYLVLVPVLVLLLSIHIAVCGESDWPMWRRDPQNTGHFPRPGNMNRTPEVIWTYFVGGSAGQAISIDMNDDGSDEVIYLSAGKLQAATGSGEHIWKTPPIGVNAIYGVFDFGEDGTREIVVANPSPPKIFLVDLDGRIVWNFTFPSPASGIGRYGLKIEDIHPGYPGRELLVWPSKTDIGYAFGFPEGAANGEVIWTALAPETRYFPPAIAIADLNLDGTDELVVTTYERLHSFNGLTGQQEMYLHSEGINRNYGTLIIKNIDGDPYPEIAVLCPNLNEHLWVVDNNGSALIQLWDVFFEYSYPEDHKEVKVTVDSLSDFDGDGSMEIAFSIFDQTGDARWYTKIWDALTGREERAIPDQYLLCIEDLDGDGIDEIITSRQTKRATVYYADTTIWDLLEGSQTTIPGLGLVMDHSIPYPPGTNTVANTEKWAFGGNGHMVYLNGSLGYMRLEEGEPNYSWVIPPGFGVSLSVRGVYQDTGVLASGDDGWFRFFNSSGHVVGQAMTGGYLPSMVAADLHGDACPEVVLKDIRGLQVVLDGNGTKISEFSSLGRRAKFGKDGSLVIWDMDGDGDPEILGGAANSLLVLHANGTPKDSYLLPTDPYDWMVANVTGDEHWDLFISSYGSGPHTAHMFGIDGKTKAVLWEKEWGPYAGFVAVTDYDDDGLDDAVVREHFDLYVVLGPTGDQKKGTNICGYHAPVVTDVDQDNLTEIVWGGGWGSLPVDQINVVTTQYGTWRSLRQRWVRYFGGGDSNEIYAKMPAVADVDGDGVKEVGIGNLNGTFHCFDGVKGGLEWRYQIGAVSSDVVSCDIDGDGFDEFILGTSDGRLLVLGDGKVEWSMDFGDTVGEPIICDLDLDTKADLLVPVMDGNLYALHISEGLILIMAIAVIAWGTCLEASENRRR